MASKKSTVSKPIGVFAASLRQTPDGTTVDLTPEYPAQVEQHIRELADDFSHAMARKYRTGFREHGGDLQTKENVVWLLDQMEAEAIDQYVYVRTVRKRLIGR